MEQVTCWIQQAKAGYKAVYIDALFGLVLRVLQERLVGKSTVHVQARADCSVSALCTMRVDQALLQS